jgi:hypothetical protein
MRTKTENLPWLIGGVVFLVLLLAFLLYFRQEANSAQQLSDKANRVDIVARMQLGLASESEAEKSSVLAVTDTDSQIFADQARAATAGVERERQEIGVLLATVGTKREQDLLAQFTDAFGNLKKLDEEVLTLAVKNTNLKAYSLLFGAAASTLAEMDAALSRVIAKHADSARAPHSGRKRREDGSDGSLDGQGGSADPWRSRWPHVLGQAQRRRRRGSGSFPIQPLRRTQGTDPGTVA